MHHELRQKSCFCRGIAVRTWHGCMRVDIQPTEQVCHHGILVLAADAELTPHHLVCCAVDARCNRRPGAGLSLRGHGMCCQRQRRFLLTSLVSVGVLLALRLPLGHRSLRAGGDGRPLHRNGTVLCRCCRGRQRRRCRAQAGVLCLCHLLRAVSTFPMRSITQAVSVHKLP